jgi:hypothetical protein
MPLSIKSEEIKALLRTFKDKILEKAAKLKVSDTFKFEGKTLVQVIEMAKRTVVEVVSVVEDYDRNYELTSTELDETFVHLLQGDHGGVDFLLCNLEVGDLRLEAGNGATIWNNTSFPVKLSTNGSGTLSYSGLDESTIDFSTVRIPVNGVVELRCVGNDGETSLLVWGDLDYPKELTGAVTYVEILANDPGEAPVFDFEINLQGRDNSLVTLKPFPLTLSKPNYTVSLTQQDSNLDKLDFSFLNLTGGKLEFKYWGTPVIFTGELSGPDKRTYVKVNGLVDFRWVSNDTWLISGDVVTETILIQMPPPTNQVN